MYNALFRRILRLSPQATNIFIIKCIMHPNVIFLGSII
ncbi:hypothetical protein CAter10_4364 [Collimonas arenae]|nr:hypothetical protein CAter10_4364 [Collimonas arenae]